MLTLSCNKCDFRANSAVMWGARSYVVGDRRVPVGCTLGWCSACGTFEAIEDLPTQQRLEDLEQTLRVARAAARAGMEQARRNQFWGSRLLGLRVRPGAAVEHLQARVDRLTKDLGHARSRLSLLATRKSPPRCLHCGATAVERVADDIDLNPAADAPTRTLSFTHPGCGGRFYASPSSFSMSVQLAHRLYDLDGKYVGDLSQ